MKKKHLGKISAALIFALSTQAPQAFALSMTDIASNVSSAIVHLQKESNSNSNTPKDFKEAKRWLSKVTIEHHPYGFYSNCRLQRSGYSIKVDKASCNYRVREDAKRASRGEAEHIVPISWVYRGMDCSKGKSSYEARSHCQKTSSYFNKAEGDLINLQYAVGEINGDRAHFKYANLDSGYDYGQNGKIYFDETGRRFMPPEETRGWIGRIHLYMSDNYPVRYSKSYRRLMESWATLKPTDWECKYNSLLKRDYSISNPYTDKVCF